MRPVRSGQHHDARNDDDEEEVSSALVEPLAAVDAALSPSNPEPNGVGGDDSGALEASLNQPPLLEESKANGVEDHEQQPSENENEVRCWRAHTRV